MTDKTVNITALLDKARVALWNMPTTDPADKFKVVDGKIKELVGVWRTRKNANNEHWASIRAAKNAQPIDQAKIDTGVKLHAKIRKLLWLCVEHWNEQHTEEKRRNSIPPEPDPNESEFNNSMAEMKALLTSMNLQTLKEFYKATKMVWLYTWSKKRGIEEWIGNYHHSFKQGIRR